MAQQSGYSNNGNGKAEKKADAWGNIAVIPKGKDAKPLNFSSGFNPVYADNGQLHRSLYEAAVAAGGEITVDAKFTVRVAAKDDGTNIEF